MKIRDILQEIQHRPWEIPKHSWKYYQEWNDAVFLHWKVEESDLRKYVPKELEIDLVNDSAWISVVGFNMENIRPRQLPAFAPISNFYEINIRTYVKFNQKTGVYFLSIEGGKELSCRIAKRMSQLPYRYSKMKRKPGIYTSENQFPKSKLDLEYQIGNLQTSKSETDLFLTERYALFQEAGNQLNEFEIHHIEWPVYELEVKILKIYYSQFPQFFQNPPDLVHYSPGVKVIAWDKKSFTMNE